MLMMKCRETDSLVIDGNIEVRIVRLSSHRVEFAIAAPSSISIDRRTNAVTPRAKGRGTARPDGEPS